MGTLGNILGNTIHMGGKAAGYPPKGPPTGWSAFTGPAHSGVTYHSQVNDVDGSTFLIAGSPSAGNDWTKFFDHNTRTYSLVNPIAELPNGTAGALVSLADGSVLANRNTNGQTWIYTQSSGTWTPQTASSWDGGVESLCRGGFVSGRDAYRFCGRDRGSGDPSANSQYFNKSLGTWTNITAFPITLERAIAVPIRIGTKAGQILVGAGGYSAGSVENYRWWYYDPVLDTYTETTTADGTTYLESPIGSVQLTNGKVYICGGSDTFNGASTNKTIVFDPETSLWSVDTTGALPWAVDATTASMSYHADGTIYLHRASLSYYSTFA